MEKKNLNFFSLCPLRPSIGGEGAPLRDTDTLPRFCFKVFDRFLSKANKQYWSGSSTPLSGHTL